MKLPTFASGRIIHGVGEQSGNAGVTTDYRRVVGGAAQPALYASFEAFPGVRGLDSTIDRLRKSLEWARAEGVGLSISFRFQGEDGATCDGAVALGFYAIELRMLAEFLASYNDVPMLIRPGTEVNTAAFGYAPAAITGAYQMFVNVMEQYGVVASWCWCIEPHGELPQWPIPELVDAVGIDIFHAAVLAEPGQPNDRIRAAVAWAKSTGKRIVVPEASPVLFGGAMLPSIAAWSTDAMLDAATVAWSQWFLPFGGFLHANDVAAFVVLPVDWIVSKGAGPAEWGDARFHINPSIACQWGQWLASGRMVHRAEFWKSWSHPE